MLASCLSWHPGLNKTIYARRYLRHHQLFCRLADLYVCFSSQCARRHLRWEYPLESHRGMKKRRSPGKWFSATGNQSIWPESGKVRSKTVRGQRVVDAARPVRRVLSFLYIFPFISSHRPYHLMVYEAVYCIYIYICLVSILISSCFRHYVFSSLSLRLSHYMSCIESDTWASRAPNAATFFNNPLSDGLMLPSRSLALSWLLLLFA